MNTINWPDKLSIRAAIAETDNILIPDIREHYVVSEIIPAKRKLPAMATCKEGGFALAFLLKEKKPSVLSLSQPQILKIFYQYWKEDFDKTKERFNLISSFIRNHQEELRNYFVDFIFLTNALRVGKETLPGIRMALVDGDTLGDFFVKCRESKQPTNDVFATLAQEFLDMCYKFRCLGISHGDLSNKNIIVTSEYHIKLIDYDSIFVPEMGRNYEQTTMGDKHFQHPKRCEGNVYASNRDDNFSQIVIYTILLALSKDSSILQFANENEVFMAEDFENESSLINSRVYKTMVQINDPKVSEMLQLLRRAVNCKKCDEIPFLADTIANREKPISIVYGVGNDGQSQQGTDTSSPTGISTPTGIPNPTPNPPRSRPVQATPTVTPWYKQWYTWVGAAILMAFLYFTFGKPDSNHKNDGEPVKTEVNVSAAIGRLEGNYTLREKNAGVLVNGIRTAAIKKTLETQARILVVSEYGPEIYEFTLDANGSIESQQLGKGEITYNEKLDKITLTFKQGERICEFTK